ncbi:MAG: hypothetical protein M0014_00135 [Actinomycetota bacterium]|nr:hypothetical protein [Actinomycetota bacterium]
MGEPESVESSLAAVRALLEPPKVARGGPGALNRAHPGDRANGLGRQSGEA